MPREDLVVLELTKEELFMLMGEYNNGLKARNALDDVEEPADVGSTAFTIDADDPRVSKFIAGIIEMGLQHINAQGELAQQWMTMFFSPETIAEILKGRRGELGEEKEVLSKKVMEQVSCRWPAVSLSLQLKLTTLARHALAEYPELSQMFPEDEEMLDISAPAVKENYDFVKLGILPPVVGTERD